MKLAEFDKLKWTPEEAIEYATADADGQLIDGRLLFNQKDTARLLLITPRAFADWPVEPVKTIGREKLYYWREVQALRDERLFGRNRARGIYR